MNNPAEHDSPTQPSRFGLPLAYQQRLQPDYFADTADDGIAALGWSGGDLLTLTADAGVVTARLSWFYLPASARQTIRPRAD